MTKPTPSSPLTDDADLFAAIRDLFDTIDPPPPDLADGVLACLAADEMDLEYELLTLVEPSDHLAGVRAAATSDHVWMLEYRSESCQVRLRIAAAGADRRVDGWVVSDHPLEVRIEPADPQSAVRRQVTTLDHGRFEFTDTGSGQAQIWFTGPDAAERPIVTPPFTI